MMERRAPGTVLPTLSPRLLQLSSLIKFSNYYQANQNSDVRYSIELSKGKIKIKKKTPLFLQGKHKRLERVAMYSRAKSHGAWAPLVLREVWYTERTPRCY